jgi:uncharacterized protein YndB with AHSA1/START domain
MSPKTDELAVRKSLVVACSVEHAFRTFTEGIAGWWPLATHSVFGDEAETAVLEGRVGGRLYERSRAGEESVWGTVTAWNPPGRLALTWHPGRGEDTAQKLELRFEPEDGATRVELVHTGWERLGADAAGQAERYEGGWTLVLGAYARRAAVGAASGEGLRSGT